MRDHIIQAFVGLVVSPTASYAGRRHSRLKAGTPYEIVSVEALSVTVSGPSGGAHQIARSDLHRFNFRTVNSSEATHDPPLEAVDH